MTERVGFVIAGGGVIGAAIGRALALRLEGKHSVLILEQRERFGAETSAHNSEVIHAGMYYAAGSLKAKFCVEGRHKLYAYLSERGLPHKKIGKLIVAQDGAEVEALSSIAARGAENGVEGLHMLEPSEARALEPHINCRAALWSGETGIFDSQAFIQSLIGDFENAGGMAVLRTPIERGAITNDGVDIHTGGAESMRLNARVFINSAGLMASRLSSVIEGVPTASIPMARWAKGSYFSSAARPPFRHLIYPAPEVGGLGVHLTFDLGGQARFGPDVEWVDDLNYAVDPARAEKFYAAVRRYWPDLPDGALTPAYCGVRPKVAFNGAIEQDFVIQGPEAHGGAPVIALYGIESPGLTSSLALADRVADMAMGALDSNAV